MSTALIARFYFDAPAPPADRLRALVTATSDAWGPPRRLEVRARDHHTVVSTLPLAGGWPAVPAAIGSIAADQGAALRTTLKAWRFDKGNAVEGTVPAALEVWGEEWGLLNHEDRRLGGEAALTVDDVGPFCAIVEPTTALHEAANARVEENLEAWMALLLRAIEETAPRSVKLYTDRGLYLPFNAHLAYWRDASAVLDDLAFIAEVWRRGLPAHRVAPLAEGARESAVLHDWRTDAQRDRLWSALAQVVDRAPSAEDVARALGSGRFDNITMPRGFTVLDYPHYLNAFVDGFLREVWAGRVSP